MKEALIVVSLGLALAGCDDARSTRAGKDGNVAVSADSSTGNVSVRVPGFSGDIRVPKGMMGSGDVDIDGVKLYPGSTTDNVDVRSSDTKSTTDGVTTGSGSATVKMSFTSPAGVATVRNHFMQGFAAKGVQATSDATGLTGTSRDGDHFTIALTPDGAARTKGVMTIVDVKE